MNAQELRQIEQRLAEGYYEGDPETLRAMQKLIQALRHFREDEAQPEPEALVV